MEPSKFDELTKALATSTSRRQALQRIGGTLTGAILASWPFGRALADNSACAHFCNMVFGGDTPASAQCATDAAHGRGLCYTCGPASPGGTKPICCPENPDGTCTSYSSATCCSSGQVCQGGTCVTPCTGNGGTCSSPSDCCSGNCSNGFCCASGQVGLSNGTCVAPCCTSSCPCGECNGDRCFCTIGGGFQNGCSNDNGCPKGYFCLPPTGVCVPAC